MLEQIFNNKTIDTLERGLGAASLRQRTISNNIANLNTPKFKKSEVIFEELLAKELYGETKKQKIVRTHDKHLPLDIKKRVMPQVEVVDKTNMRYDKNNVDIDIEMSEMAKNQIYYNAVVRELGGYFTTLKSVITGQ